MDFRDQILRTFKKKKLERIVWQPRIMLWYNSNRVKRMKPENDDNKKKFVPREYMGKKVIEIHKDLNASIRYCDETLNLPLFYVRVKRDREIKLKFEGLKDGSTLWKISTPIGKISQRLRDGYAIEKWVKKIEDLKVMKYVNENVEFVFNEANFETAEKKLGTLGIPQSYYFRSPYQRAVLEILGFERTVIFLRRYPEKMEDFFRFLEEWDRENYEVILNSKVKILNFGENIDQSLSSPREFEKFHIPYYEERVKWVHKAGKFCHIHIDGHVEDLLPYLADLPFDGIEALTPKPQGDVTLEQLKEAVGDKILLDVIPATLFMPQYPKRRLVECVKTILEYFAPNLILGVSDELPGNVDGRRLQTVSEIVSKFAP